MNFRYPPPDNEKSFEKFCLKLLKRHWSNSQLELFGQRGERQFGIDIIDPSVATPFKAAQCKNHEPYITIPPAEIEAEVAKVLTFKTPTPLEHYAILTSGRATTHAQNKIIEINREHREKNLFIVELLSWDKIADLLDDYPEVANLLINISHSHLIEIEDTFRRGVTGLETQISTAFSGISQTVYDTQIDEAEAHLDHHDPQMARMHFESIRKRHWDSLSAQQKYRVKIGFSNVALSQGKDAEAGRLLLEAKELNPESERARVNEAIGYEFLGHRDRAHSLAEELLKSYPTSSKLIACSIRTSPSRTPLEELTGLVTPVAEHDPEVNTALALRAAGMHRFEDAERYARIAASANPGWVGPKFLVGQSIYNCEIMKARRTLREHPESLDVQRIDEAISTFTQAIHIARQQGNDNFAADCLVFRALAKSLKGDHKGAEDDYNEAMRQAPGSPAPYFRYAVFLSHCRRIAESIAQLKHSLSIKSGWEAEFLLADMLNERDEAGDLNEATDIFARLAQTDVAGLEASTPSWTDQEQLENIRAASFQAAMSGFVEGGRIEEGTTFLAGVPADRFSAVGMATAHSMLSLAKSDYAAASSYADEALKALTEATAKPDLRGLALQLMKLERHKDALHIWLSLNESGQYNNDVRHLVRCAERVQKYAVILSVAKEMREAGIDDRWLLQKETAILESIDINQAIQILQDHLSNHPDDKVARIELSRIGLALDRADLVDARLEALPRPDEATPYGGRVAVDILRHHVDPNEAVRYAYELLRRNYDDHEANAALVISVLHLDSPSPTILDATEAGPGIAVRYAESDGRERWIVIEDSPNPIQALDEYPPSHPLAQALRGKKVGDSFVISKTSARDRIGTIKEMLSKYVHRMRSIAETWQLRFPDHPFIQIFKVADTDESTGETTTDLTDLTLIADRRYSQTAEAERIFQSNFLSLHVLSQLVGCDPYEAVVAAALRMKLPVRCNRGQPEERASALAAISGSHTIVLDITAIATIGLLGLRTLLENWQGKLVISQSTSAHLREMLQKFTSTRRGHSHFGKNEGGYYFQETPPEALRQQSESFSDFVQSVFQVCEVRGCQDLVGLEPEIRERLANVLGQHGTESILLAKPPGHVLWTDDLFVSDVASSEFSVRRIWTQVAVEYARTVGTVFVDDYLTASAKLLGLNYQATLFNQPIVFQAGMLAEWKADVWPFSEILNLFASNEIKIADVLLFASFVIVSLYNKAPLVETRQNTLIRILERIASRREGLSSIYVLRTLLPRVFGVNVLASDDASGIVNAWLAQALRRPFA